MTTLKRKQLFEAPVLSSLLVGEKREFDLDCFLWRFAIKNHLTQPGRRHETNLAKFLRINFEKIERKSAGCVSVFAEPL